MDGTKIQWTDATWNPIRGCSRISEGCRNCYAERIAARFSDPGMPYAGLAKRTKGGPRWTGKVRVVEEALDQPQRWSRPRRIFVNSMSDLFHESLPDRDVERVFGAIWLAPRHTFQILTKRAHRMRAVMKSWAKEASWKPQPNIWLGTSVEDQAAAEDRIPALLDTPAAIRWLSMEPLIGPVKVPDAWIRGLDWIVIGGESGPGARPFQIPWAVDLVIQAKLMGVPVFMKQLGADPRIHDGRWPTSDRKGSVLGEFPRSLQVRDYPEPDRGERNLADGGWFRSVPA